MPQKLIHMIDGWLKVKAQWTRDEMNVQYLQIGKRKFKTAEELWEYATDEADLEIDRLETIARKPKAEENQS